MSVLKVKDALGNWIQIPTIKGETGDDGEDGFSPTVATSKSGKTTTVTITDAQGAHSFQILDGEDGSGAGDMLKSVYDTDNDGIVDHAELADEVAWDDVTSKPSTFTPASHTHTKSEVTDFSHTHDDRYYTETEIDTKLGDYIPTSAKATANGVATLDASGFVPSAQLPSYVDDVLEYASQSAFPATGETGKIYVATDTNITYRWGGTAYAEISASLALGETSSTAYAGDKGAECYAAKHTHSNKAVLDGIDSTDITNWDGKYTKPSSGIPTSDLAIPSDVTTSSVRKIYAGTTDMTAGTTALATGVIYLVYEA